MFKTKNKRSQAPEELGKLAGKLVSRREAIRKAGAAVAGAGIAFLGLGLPGIGRQKQAHACCNPSLSCVPCGNICSAGCSLYDCTGGCLAICAPGVGVASVPDAKTDTRQLA